MLELETDQQQEFLGKVLVKIRCRIIDIPKMECNKTETKTNQKQCKTFLIFLTMYIFYCIYLVVLG